MTDTFYRVATDTGGTFTDFVVFDEAHQRLLDHEGPVDTR